MNLAAISDNFAERITAMTEGTKYDKSSQAFDCVPEVEERVREVVYLLWKDATSQELADYLERTAAQYFQELYEFSYGVTSCWLAKGTERLAWPRKRIAAGKLNALERATSDLIRFWNNFPSQDNEVLQVFYMKRQKVDYEQLRGVIEKHLTMIEAVYEAGTVAAEERTKAISAKIEGPAPKRKY
ncbi:hypothetical protein [Metasolibacillus meyeri]|uniref:hypothetical protein n=1 Tax=Metasolibacillus meyeri TaxID=1071052 RepID=UPI000D31BCC1|nr:hypothetical protein [Metasolibacillus meyeri]